MVVYAGSSPVNAHVLHKSKRMLMEGRNGTNLSSVLLDVLDIVLRISSLDGPASFCVGKENKECEMISAVAAQGDAMKC